jgi:enterochelin esterase-like enzyme
MPATACRTIKLAFFAFCLLSFAFSTLAQQREATPNDTLVSPLIEGGTVTVQIYAPIAQSVTVLGDWMLQRQPLPLTKAANGVWSVKLDNLSPDYYSYTLTVDGVATLDPKNPEIKQGIRSVENMFYLQGPETGFQDNTEVPHGHIRSLWYVSAMLGMQRRMHVYTPPGYDQSNLDYPVFFLLHGAGDDDSGWSSIGRAGFILDNLIASGQANPMIVVMPNGSLPPANLPANASDAQRQAAALRFEREFMEEIVPTVEREFRVKRGINNRAIAGLSMGGGHTLQVFGHNPETFAYVSIWSAGVGNVAEAEATYASLLASTRQLNYDIKHLSIIVGRDDFAFPNSTTLSELFKKHGIEHQFIETGGGHTWLNWRHYLHLYAQQLFW